MTNNLLRLQKSQCPPQVVYYWRGSMCGATSLRHVASSHTSEILTQEHFVARVNYCDWLSKEWTENDRQIAVLIPSVSPVRKVIWKG